MYQSIVFSAAAIACLLVLFLFKRKSADSFDFFLKVLTVAFCAIAFIRFFLSDAFIYVINGAWFEDKYYESTDVLQSILRWGYYTCYTAFPMAVFYNNRFFRNVASYVSFPFAILSTIYFNDYMEYFLSPIGHGYHLSEWFRYVYFILELVIALMIPMLLQIKKKHYINIKDRKEVLSFFLILPLFLAISIPTYLPQSFLGYSVFKPKTFGTFHIVWLAVLFVVTLALYYVFRFKSYDARYQLCMFLTILLFFHYDSLYLMGITIKRLPFQLCNIASYFYIIIMAFKLKKMYQFCFIANIVGALIAMLMPDFASGNYSFWTTHFIFEHSLVLIVPAMYMGLRIFPRLTRKSLKYFFIGFTIYFLFSFVIGTILNGYADVTGERVNYFFMFDLDMAFDYVPAVKGLADVHFEFGRFEVYPLIVGIIYVLFTLVCYLFYLFVKFLYKFEDDHIELRRSRIDLIEKITHKPSRRPKNFID